eukprot:g7916.t1
MDPEELKQVFQRIDLDNSGTLELEELETAARELGVKCSKNSLKKVFKLIDIDQSGSIDFDEFSIFFAKVSNPDRIKEVLSQASAAFLDYRNSCPKSEAAKYNRHLNATVESVRWVGDGIFLAATGEGKLLSFDISGDQVAQRFQGQTTPIFSCCLGKDIALSGGKDGMVVLNDLETGACIRTWQVHEGLVTSIALAKDGHQVCTASRDGRVVVFDINAGELPACLVSDIEDAAAGYTVCHAVWCGEDELLSAGDDYCVKRWDVRKPRDPPLASYMGHTSCVRSLAVSPDGSLFASGAVDSSVHGASISDFLEQLKKRREEVIERVHEGEGDLSEVRELNEEIETLEQKAKEKGDKEPWCAIERCVFNFLMMSVACMENCGKVEVVVTRSGLLDCMATVGYRTKDGTATSVEDFKPTEGKLSFNPGEEQKSFEVEIVDDDRCEDQEEFYIELLEPKVHKNGDGGKDSIRFAILGDNAITTIKIIDKDIPGIFCFDHEHDQVEVHSKPDVDVKFDVMVKRIEGASGKAVRISASTFRLSVQGLGPLGVQVAVCRVIQPRWVKTSKRRKELWSLALSFSLFLQLESCHFRHVRFTPGECEKKIEMTIKGRKRYEQTQMHWPRLVWNHCECLPSSRRLAGFMGSSSSQAGFCECKDVVNKVIHADAVEEQWQVSAADEMDVKPQEETKVEDRAGGSYTGEWLGCFRHGKGTQVWADGSCYSGQWLQDVPHGKGRLEQGDVYDGQWRYGKACGHGIHIAANKVRYEGEWVNDQKHGHGEEHYADGGRFSGSYEEGYKSGEGLFRWPDGSEYKGHFFKDYFCGHGRQKWPDGRSYDGQWQANLMHGQGRFKWPDGRSYHGTYRDGLRHGQGKFVWPDGRIYEGEWEAGKQHGKGWDCCSR